MAYSRRALYCDESKIHGSGPFYFGMLDLSPRRAEILAAKLLAVKQAHNCAGEMKWVKKRYSFDGTHEWHNVDRR